MPRPDPKRPRLGQLELIGGDEVAEMKPGHVLRGRHSEAMDRAIDCAYTQDALASVDEGLATILRAGAWALDALEAQNKPYGPAKLLTPMTEALREARMTPDSRSQASSDITSVILADLAKAEAAEQ